VRQDGKAIQLFPMAHVGDARFYRSISAAFPTNSVVLLEGVSDQKNLLTNRITYTRMASSLGVAEQQKEFRPTQGQLVRADIDVDQFAVNTIGFLNLVMLLHSKGITRDSLLALMQFSPPPGFEQQLWDDLLHKRNRHLLDEIETRLAQSDILIVPWGAAHMPGISKEIQKAGFHLNESREFVVIRFRRGAVEPARR
jgi:hypothetical protein